jgi:anti-sigma-K factor RskA
VSGTNGRTCGEDAAAYVLGALEPAEVEAFRRHMVECADCREEVAAFEQVTAALPPAGSARYEVPKELRRRVMREVRAAPKQTVTATRVPTASRWRPNLAWGGALAAIIVAVILAFALSSGGSSTRTIEASTGSAELRVTGDRGDLIVHRLPQLPAGRIYEMWVQRGTAQPTPTGTLFGVTVRGSVALGVPGSLNGVSAVMVTQEPAGGSLAPTSAPVIVARLS